MIRLRVRIELNRRMTGVPLEKMASVVEETRKFFHLLSEDVKIDVDRGQWVASDFDAASLNFTAEFNGPVSTENVHAFGAAFSGATSLRRATIAQFTRIADFLGEDELVGFGLYQSDQETEPSEWRCLSKRAAVRFGEEIKLLAEAAGGLQTDTQLPAVMNGAVAGRRLFKDRRERDAMTVDPSKLLRELETNLSRRIGALENELTVMTRRLQELSSSPDTTAENLQRLLLAMETFWAQAPRQAQLPPAPPPPPQPKPRRLSILGLAVAAVVVILSAFAFPEMQHQWVRLTSIEALPAMKVGAPAAPVMAAYQSIPRPPVKTIAADSPEPFAGPLIPLEIPAQVRSKIQSEVRVDVVVAVDDAGNVTHAHVSGTRGESARLLVAEALRAARQSHFRPAQDGKKTVHSQMMLTFLFQPESDQF